MGNHETRQQLIDAGIEAMTRRSYNAVGIKEILDAVGVPKGSFYHFFKSKEDFGVAIIEHYASVNAARTAKFLADKSRPPLERLRGWFQLAIDWHEACECKQTCLIARLGMDVATMSPAMQTALRYGMDQTTALIAKCLAEAQVAGDLPPAPEFDPDRTARFLHNGWEGACVRLQIEQSPQPLRDFVDFVFVQVLEGGGLASPAFDSDLPADRVGA